MTGLSEFGNVANLASDGDVPAVSLDFQNIWSVLISSLIDIVDFRSTLRCVDVPDRTELGGEAIAQVPLDVVHVRVFGVSRETNQESLLVPLRGRILRDHLDPPEKLCLRR